MNKIIEVKDLSFSYDVKKEKNVLENANLTINKGELVALIGRNGCGKSTLLNCLLGINKIQKGSIKIKNKDINDYSTKELSKKIAYIPQTTITNMDFTVKEFISFGRTPHISLLQSLKSKDYEIVLKYAKHCGIESILDKNINNISGGERQLAFVARALAQETEIIIMDEPTAALDFGNQQKLFKTLSKLSKEGKTIIFTTHNPNHIVGLKTSIFIVHDAQINQIKKLDLKTLQKIYGSKFKLGKGFVFDIED